MTTAIDTRQEVLPGLMTAEEARDCIAGIRSLTTSALEKLEELWAREGWRALKYRSWEAFLKGEFPQSGNYLGRQLRALEVARNIGVPIGTVREGTLRPLSGQHPEIQRAAYADASADGKVTAAKLTEAVERRRTPGPTLDTAVPDYAVDGVEDEIPPLVQSDLQRCPHGRSADEECAACTEGTIRDDEEPDYAEKPEEVCSHGLPVEGHCPECEDEYIEQRERKAENLPEMPEPEQVEQIPCLDAENAQDAILSPSSALPPLHVPARGAQTTGGRDKQATREAAGGEDLDIGALDLAALNRAGVTVGEAVGAVARIIEAAERGGKAWQARVAVACRDNVK